jgi:hypothetical protein
MPRQSDENKELWLWLLNDAGAWTVMDLAMHLRRDPDRLFAQLSGMVNNGHLEKFPPSEGSRRLRYGVTGTCRIPLGLHVGEVQWNT